jgi:hypothetical protein
MTTIAKYQPVSDPYTTYRVSSDNLETPITELCELDGWRYLSIPDDITPVIPAQITTYETVELTDALRETLKATSPHAKLIAQRVIDRIRAQYPLDDELYFARIAVGALQGSYTLLPGEAEALAQYQVDVEAAREWGRQERAKLGL